jgi:NDP-sugar pyrophosphorylase family protein
MVSMGIYVFSKAVLEYVPFGKKFGFDDLMLTLLDAGEPVNAFVYDGYWLDIGRPSDYEIANRDIDKISSLLE